MLKNKTSKINQQRTILFFGENNIRDMRNLVMIEAFKKLGFAVKLYNLPYSRLKIHFWAISFLHLFRLKEIKYIYLGFPANSSILVAKLLCLTNKNVKIIYNPNVMYYETHIEDYEKFHKKHPISKFLKFLDRLFIRFADIFITDSQAHKIHYVKSLSINSSKVMVLPVGVDPSVFSIIPNNQLLNNSDKKFTNVVFYGSFNPLQGVDIIIKAFHLLKNEQIMLYIIGNGPTFDENLKLSNKLALTNIKFINWLGVKSLFEFVKCCDISLGIFGGTIKSKIVVPNKVYQSLALGRIVITQDSPAIHEFFTKNKHLVLVKPNSPVDLANKIRKIHENQEFYQKFGENGKSIMENKYVPDQIKELIGFL